MSSSAHILFCGSAVFSIRDAIYDLPRFRAMHLGNDCWSWTGDFGGRNNNDQSRRSSDDDHQEEENSLKKFHTRPMHLYDHDVRSCNIIIQVEKWWCSMF